MKNKNRKKNKWTEYFILSLAIHILLFYFWGKDIDIFHTAIIDTNQPVDVYTIQKEKQIVNIDQDSNEPLNTKAEYLSKSNVRVEQQTKAREWGKPKNVKSQTFYSLTEEDTSKAIDEYVKSKREKSEKNEASATYDYLPNVKTGEHTLLNTAEFIYYSFYRRVQEAIVPLWNEQVSLYLRKNPYVKKKLRKNEYITDVQVVLDKDGYFRKIAVITSSGVAGFDDAPAYAFSEAAPFENPPKGMIMDNGLLMMKWRFVVNIVESVKYGVEYIDDFGLNRRRSSQGGHLQRAR